MTGAPVRATAIAAFLGRTLAGPDVPITKPAPLSAAAPGSLLFATKFDAATAAALNAVAGTVVIAHADFDGQLRGTHMLSPTPRLDFARAAQEFFPPPRAQGVARTAIVATSARLGQGTVVGHFTVIGEGVTVGDGSEIRHHCIIGDGTIIGRNCLIKSHTVIGEEGFGFEFEDDGTPVRLPHYGRVVIGDAVEVGALNVIARATLGETRLADRVKTDDHVFIGHNVTIGENTIITAAAEIGGCVIGRNVWIGPQSSIIEKVEIGDGALIGIGSVVIRSVEPNAVVAGNPARFLRKRFER